MNWFFIKNPFQRLVKTKCLSAIHLAVMTFSQKLVPLGLLPVLLARAGRAVKNVRLPDLMWIFGLKGATGFVEILQIPLHLFI
ncbi:MAG: hypothetical protein ONB43_13850 [candidate division KSB1 bacterium]|nr:hypothetical protein [candidate division KSB1 bacterium]